MDQRARDEGRECAATNSGEHAPGCFVAARVPAHFLTPLECSVRYPPPHPVPHIPPILHPLIILPDSPPSSVSNENFISCRGDGGRGVGAGEEGGTGGEDAGEGGNKISLIAATGPLMLWHLEASYPTHAEVVYKLLVTSISSSGWNF